MKEKITDLIYIARGLCEILRDRNDILDYDEEIRDCLEELEAAILDVGDAEDAEDENGDE